jgi:hypothetical protein
MSKRFTRIIEETTHRWRETITSTAPPNVARAKTLLQAAFPQDLRFFEARSPLEFYIAQAVLRGRFSKKAATELATELGIDTAFIKPLTRIGRPIQLTNRACRWASPESTTNTMLAVIQRHFHNMATAEPPRPWLAYSGPRIMVSLQDLHALYRFMFPVPKSNAPVDERAECQTRDWRLNFLSAQAHVDMSYFSLHEAVSGFIDDIMLGLHIPNRHKFDAVQAEIICKAIGCKDPQSIWPYEIFHHVPAFMQFDSAYLLLTDRPVFQVTAEEQLHNDTGPAVVWPDGKKLWYVDGHYLSQYGEQIVMAPTTLTKEMIFNIDNEEERRVAIDRMGWHNYLTAIKAKIADSRENWVDNTFEVLIDPPDRPGRRPWGPSEPLRMVLSCRSTGRKYFIAVPRTVRHPDSPVLNGLAANENELKEFPDQAITNCEQAQKWLADGATTAYLPYAKYPINVVGAS